MEKGKYTFEDFLVETMLNKNFTKEFDRLNNSEITKKVESVVKRGAFTQMIDEATGHNPFSTDEKFSQDFKDFRKFIYNYIWLPVLNEFNKKQTG